MATRQADDRVRSSDVAAGGLSTSSLVEEGSVAMMLTETVISILSLYADIWLAYWGLYDKGDHTVRHAHRVTPALPAIELVLST